MVNEMTEEEKIEKVWKEYNDSWAYSRKKFEFRYKECKDDFKNKLWSYQLWANSDNYKGIGYLKKGCEKWNAYLKYGAVNLNACVHFLKGQLYRRQNLIEKLEKESKSDWFRTTTTWKEILEEGKITSKEILQEADEIFLELKLYIQEILDKGIDEEIEQKTYKLKDSINYFIEELIEELLKK